MRLSLLRCIYVPNNATQSDTHSQGLKLVLSQVIECDTDRVHQITSKRTNNHGIGYKVCVCHTHTNISRGFCAKMLQDIE